jgi:hypothetical protein
VRWGRSTRVEGAGSVGCLLWATQRVWGGGVGAAGVLRGEQRRASTSEGSPGTCWIHQGVCARVGNIARLVRWRHQVTTSSDLCQKNLASSVIRSQRRALSNSCSSRTHATATQARVE